jgi:hypothetical protein
MTIPLSQLVRELQPRNTVLLFGSGSSIPSGAPSVAELVDRISKTFGIAPNGYKLDEIAGIAEAKVGRKPDASMWSPRPHLSRGCSIGSPSCGP